MFDMDLLFNSHFLNFNFKDLKTWFGLVFNVIIRSRSICLKHVGLDGGIQSLIKRISITHFTIVNKVKCDMIA